MSMNEQGGYGVDGVPPVLPGDLGEYHEPAAWPKVVGVLSIVQGSLGVLANTCGGCFLLVGPSWFEAFLRNIAKDSKFKPQPGQNPLEAADTMALMKPWMAAQGVVAMLTLATSVWLLVAGIRMVKRKRSTVGMHKGWAWTRIGLALLMAAVGLVSTVATAERQAEIKIAYGSSATATGVLVQGVVVGVLGLVVILVYPIVVLVVLGKPWAKSEVARWSDGDRADDGAEFR